MVDRFGLLAVMAGVLFKTFRTSTVKATLRAKVGSQIRRVSQVQYEASRALR
ncbi:hypothetical protein D3C77_753150 [compost metagenome]